MNENGYPKRRNLDGIYFRVERDGKWQNICFTDLTADERTALMTDKPIEWYQNLIRGLVHCIRNIGDQLDIECE